MKIDAKIGLLALFVGLIGLLGPAGMAHAETGPTYSNIAVSNQIYSPFPAQQGGPLVLYLELTNTGSNTENAVNFTIVPQFPFSLAQGQGASQYFTSIPSEGSVLLSYQLYVDPKAIGGPNSLPYTVSINGQQLLAPYSQSLSGQAQSSMFSLNISVSAQNNVIISNTYPTLLEPGQAQPLTFTLQNAGNADVHGINFKWTEPTGTIVPLGSGNSQYISVLPAGASYNVTFQAVADPSANPGVYSINTTYTYFNGNVTETDTGNEGVLVGGFSQLEADITGYSGGQLSLSVANVGNNPASSVSVTIPTQPGVTVVGGASTSFLGNLLKGDFTVASFNIIGAATGTYSGATAPQSNTGIIGQVEGALGIGNSAPATPAGGFNRTRGGTGGFGGATSSENLTVDMTYTDTLGNQNTIVEQIPFNPTLLSATTTGTGGAGFARPTSSSSNTLYYGIAVLVIIAAGYWYFRIRPKKKKPAETVSTK